MDDCVFCKIAKGVAPASVVYSDEKVMAFLDIQPVNLGHVLVIPRAHAKELSELDPEVGGQMLKAAMVVAEGLRKSGVKCEGANLFLADGEAAFQEIFHVHLHVIPRFRGDGFGLKFGPSYGIKPERKEMDTIAEQIRRAIGAHHRLLSLGIRSVSTTSEEAILSWLAAFPQSWKTTTSSPEILRKSGI